MMASDRLIVVVMIANENKNKFTKRGVTSCKLTVILRRLLI